MQIVPFDKVTFSREHGFPDPFEATEEQIRSALYVTELWPMSGPLLHVGKDLFIVVTFDELSQSFDEWDQIPSEDMYHTVFEWIRDCIDNGLHPCQIQL